MQTSLEKILLKVWSPHPLKKKKKKKMFKGEK